MAALILVVAQIEEGGDAIATRTPTYKPLTLHTAAILEKKRIATNTGIGFHLIPNKHLRFVFR